MDLPVRIVRDAPAEPFIAADGHMPGATLELSHWPGNSTPAALRHDLSSGAALAFARLAARERERLAGDAESIVNNHFDTDGSCALFAVRHPGQALPRAAQLLAAARAGDFFQWPDDDALALDAIVSGLVDAESSPLRATLAGRDDLQRWQLATEHLLEELPALLDGERAPYRALWEPVLEAARADRADLAACARDDLVHLDWTVWTAARGRRSTRSGAGECFDPGRHALFGASPSDRQLVVGQAGDGATFRLIFGTLSWFDLVSRSALPRPDLAALARRLDELEGSAPSDPAAWRSQDTSGPSPELWFGLDTHVHFDEHAPVLLPSRLEPQRVRREIADTLRTVLAQQWERT
jgi:hypothetical protein